MSFTSRILTPADDDKLITFLDALSANNPSVLGYHYPIYRDMLQHCGVGQAMSIGCFQDDVLVGCIPLFIKESDGECALSSMPYFGPNAGVLCDYSSEWAEEIHALLLNEALALAVEKNAVSISFYTPFQNNATEEYYVQHLHDAYVVDKHTTYIELDKYEPDSSLRYDLRKAESAGVKIMAVRNDDDIIALNDIYQKNCADYGIPPKSLDCLRLLANASNEGGNTTTWLAMLDNKIVAGLIMIFSPATASYYLPCSLHEYRTQQPSTVLIHHAMMHARSRGIRLWNWESSPSKESGVYKFKKKWGSMDGTYKIFVKPLRNTDYFRTHGSNGISSRFPYFFVYPFNLLQPA
ncbi:MAG: GNAT family N-acetyltransferase [Flavobacteriales bacterium]